MLTLRNVELLTAFVDGELTPRQRKAVLRLLHRSSEARSILQDLQESSHRLRELPRRTLGDSFAAQVLQAIADRGIQPAPEQPVLRHGLRWAVYAAAAALLLAVGTGVYLAIMQQAPHADSGVVVADRPDTKPEPAAVPPLQVAFRELALKPTRELVARKLQNEAAIHLDLTVRDNAHAVDHLQDVLNDHGIKIIVDPEAQASLKKGGKAEVEYLVYVENVRIQELEAILWQLAEVPKNPSLPKGTFESMIVTSLSREDRQRLSGLFGVHVSELEPPARAGDATRFENNIIAAAKDKVKSSPPIPAAEPDRYAMVMASDRGNGGASSEVREFLASRRQQRPGTVQVLLVIRLA